MTRILCVDDDASIRVLVHTLLTKLLPAEVTTLSSGDEALAWLGEHPAPDAILLDVMMPGMDGYQTFYRIREQAHLADTLVVFLSAHGDLDTLQCPLLRATPRIAKPFSVRTFPDELRTLLTRARSAS